MITMFGLFINVTLNNDFYQIQPGERSYMAPTLIKTYIVFYCYLAVAYIYSHIDRECVKPYRA